MPPRRPRGAAFASGSDERDSVGTRSTRRAEDVSDILAYEVKSTVNASRSIIPELDESGVRSTRRAPTSERGRYRVLDNDVYEPLAPSRRVNAGKEDGKAADGKFDATSLLKLLGESYNLKDSSGGAARLETKGGATETGKTTAGVVGRAATTMTTPAVEPTSPPIGGRRTPYEFVMLKDENVKQRTTTRETVTAKREENYYKSVTFNANETSMVGDSDSPATAKPPTGNSTGKATPWSTAVSEREASIFRGTSGQVARTIATYRDMSRRVGDDSAVRDSSQEGSPPKAVGDTIAAEKPPTAKIFTSDPETEEEPVRSAAARRFLGIGNAAYAATTLPSMRDERRRHSKQAKPTRSTASRQTQRSTGSQQSDSLMVQYQQGDQDEVVELLEHRRGHLLVRLLSWLNTRLSAATGFKVAPSFPLEKRIERFVVGEGMQV